MAVNLFGIHPTGTKNVEKVVAKKNLCKVYSTISVNTQKVSLNLANKLLDSVFTESVFVF
jgi:hypothetical protein